MTRAATDIPEGHRCRFQIRRPGSAELVECNDIGGWVLDEKRKTWRPANPGDRKRRCWLHGPGSSRRPIGRNRKVDQPNERLQRYAALILGISLEATKAQRDITDELSLLGYPSSGGTARVSSNSDPVGGDVARIVELVEMRETLRDRINDDYIGDWLTDLIQTIAKARRRPPAAMGAKLCRDNQVDRPGSVEWGDPLCTELPVKAELCPRCYQAEHRWLKAHGMETHDKPIAEDPPECH